MTSYEGWRLKAKEVDRRGEIDTAGYGQTTATASTCRLDILRSGDRGPSSWEVFVCDLEGFDGCEDIVGWETMVDGRGGLGETISRERADGFGSDLVRWNTGVV